MRQPYFATHGVGVLYFLVLVTWYGAEIVMFFRQLQWRKGAKRIAQPGFWAFFGVSVIAAVTMLYVAPVIVPAANIRDPAIAFAVGMVLLASGASSRSSGDRGQGPRVNALLLRVSSSRDGRDPSRGQVSNVGVTPPLGLFSRSVLAECAWQDSNPRPAA